MRIDAHCHVGISGLSCYLTDKRYTAHDLIETMDRCGIDKACVSGGGLPHEIKKMNEDALDAVKRYPDRIIGFVRVNPWFEDMLYDIDYYIGECGFKGIKLHPMQDCYCLLLEPKLQLIFEKAEKYKIPVYIHSGSEPWTMPGQVADQALMFPNVKFIMGHSCMNNLYQHLIPSARRAKNVVLESSIGPATGAVGQLGKDRVIFGSDWPTTSMRSQLKKVEDAALTDDERDDVLGGTIARILGLR